MKKIMCFFVVLSGILTNGGVKKDSYSQYVNKSYIVMDSNTNKVIEGKNVNEIRNVASVSKIMSAIIAIENGELEKEVVINKDDTHTYGSSIYLQEGDKITLLDLIYGLMLRSGNDASQAIARSVGGSIENFVLLMNQKARELGMNNSSFNNPSGLDANEIGNLSTSYDLALLMSYAIKNEVFLKISGSKEYSSNKGVWTNKNKLLLNYKYTIAGKTGFTYKAKRTLVTASKKEDTTLVVVTLDCGNDFNFHKFLYEKNFELYQSVKVLEKGENYIEDYILTCNKDIYSFLKKEEIDKYVIKHSLKGKISEIFLISDREKIKIGSCDIQVNEKIKKLTWIEKIRKNIK